MASWAGGGACRKKRSVEHTRHRVQQKLDSIYEQKEVILQTLCTVTENVTSITAKAEETAQALLDEKDCNKMMHRLTPAMTQLEEFLNRLILIQYSLQGEELETEASDIESRDTPLTSSPRIHKIKKEPNSSEINLQISNHSQVIDPATFVKSIHSSIGCTPKDARTQSETETNSGKTTVHVDHNKETGMVNMKEQEEISERVPDTIPDIIPDTIHGDISVTDLHSRGSEGCTSSQNPLQNESCMETSLPQEQTVIESPECVSNVEDITVISRVHDTSGDPETGVRNDPGIGAISDTGQAASAVQDSNDFAHSSCPELEASCEFSEQSSALVVDRKDAEPGEPAGLVGEGTFPGQTSCAMLDETMEASNVLKVSHDKQEVVSTNYPTRPSNDGLFCTQIEATFGQMTSSAGPSEGTGEGSISRRKKKNLRKNKKVAELLKGIDQIVDSAMSTDLDTLTNQGPYISPLVLKEGELIEVYITEVIDPSFFWIQPQSADLDDLADKLTYCYKNAGSKGQQLHLVDDPLPGMIVCGCFTKDDEWYRARIMAVHSKKGNKKKTYVDVLYIDFGNREKLNLDRIRTLSPEFFDLPCQAFPCALSQTGSPDGSDVWPDKIRQDFAQFVTRSEVTFSALLTKLEDCPLCIAELYFPLQPTPLGQRMPHMQVASVMHSVTDLMIKEERARNLDNVEIVQIYHHRMAMLTACDKPKYLQGKLEELDVHREQSPRLVCKWSDTQPKKSSKQTAASEKAGKKSSRNSDEWKSQILDDSFDNLLDIELKRSVSSEQDLPRDKPSELSVEQGGVSEAVKMYNPPDPKPLEIETADDSKELVPPNESSSGKMKKNSLKKSNLDRATKVSTAGHETHTVDSSVREMSAQEKNVEAKSPKKPKSSCQSSEIAESESKQNNQEATPTNEPRSSSQRNTAQSHPPESSSALGPKQSDQEPTSSSKTKSETVNLAGTTPVQKKESRSNASEGSEKVSSVSSSTVQQKLLDRGLPEKSPVACQFSDQYQKWVEGDNSALESVVCDLSNKIFSPVRSESSTSRLPKSSTSVGPKSSTSVGPKSSSLGLKSSSKKSDGPQSDCPSMPSPKVSDLSSQEERSASEQSSMGAGDYELKDYPPLTVEIPEDSCVTFLMAHIDSPGKFYIHLVSEETGNSLEKLKEDLNSFFENDRNVMMKKYFDSRELRMNTLCCAQFEEDRCLYRAKIIGLCHTVRESVRDAKHPSKKSKQSPDSEKKVSQVQVFYVDFGNSAWVSVSKVFPLPPKFTEIAPQAICCTLKGVEPSPQDDPTGDSQSQEGDNSQWSLAARKTFANLTGFSKELVGYVVDSKAGDIYSPTEEKPLPLVVVDTSSTENVWVGEELVRKGLCKMTEIHKIPSVTYEVPEDAKENDVPGNWNPMSDDYLEERNSMFIDTDDPAVATMGYKPNDEDRVCFYYNKKGGCWRKHCPYVHEKNIGEFTIDKKPVFCAYDADHLVLPPVTGSWIILEVATIISPSHFYAIFPFGTKPVLTLLKEETSSNRNDEGYEGSQTSSLESIDSLMENMSQHYSRLPHRDTDYTVYGEGEVVACLFTEDNCWYRSRIIDSDPDNQQVQVFYVDFGNREWVPESRIRQMEPQFMHLPFQALECFLPLDPLNRDGTWPSEARETFHGMVDGRVLFGFVLESGFNGVLTLNLYDTTDEEIHINQSLVERGLASIPPEPTSSMEQLASLRSAKKVSKQTSTDRSSATSSQSSLPPRLLPG